MNTIEIKNKFDVLLKQLSAERSFDVAEKITAELVGLLNIKTTDRFLVNIPRVDAELTRFQLAPGFARQAAAYELPHEDGKPIDLKLFWIKKASKTNLSWLIGLTPNFEDALSNDYKNIGIDFVVSEACDSLTVLLSNRFKVRALELKDHITPTQLEIFSQWAKLTEVEITDQNEFKNNLHSKLWESFNFEPINRKFYLELVEHFSILVHYLEKDLGRKPSVMFTTRLIGRLLFIWFLKKKNLVNTNVDYFSVPDPEKQSEYYKSQLEKLFFEVLNRDELERNNGDKLTPYLNGGLFDKSTTDFCDDPKLTFPKGYFNQLFITLNKYNFTVDESSPEFQHVAIDPEMLGRIFESLLAEQIDENTGNSKKKATGAFYTPREIVSYMCEQSLIEYLKTKVTKASDRDRRIEELVRMPEAIFRDQDQNKRRDWKPYRESIIKALEGTRTESALTVLDPAVGSGAFPMGMLHLLVKVYSRLDPKFEKDISGLKRDILSRSLYGVDIEQTAIEITRLRAWLSIIVDIPEGEKVEPLPNLEFKFVCANTLIPLDNSEQATFFTDHDLKYKLIAIRDEYFKTSSKVKKEKLQKDYLKLTQSASLFDNKKTQQLKSYKPFDISSSSEFYDPELMHGVQGFDIVIGNPPYNVELKDSERLFYKNTYSSVSSGRQDTAAIFVERAKKIAKENFIICFIIPYRLFSRKRNHGAFQEYILNNISINEIIYLGKDAGFESAKDEFMVSLFSKYIKGNLVKICNKPDFRNLNVLNFNEINQSIFEDNKEININISNFNSDVLQKIESSGYILSDICEVKDGIVPYIREKMINKEKIDDRYVKFAGVSGTYKLEKYCFTADVMYLCYDMNEARKHISDIKELRKVQLRDKNIFLQNEKILTSQNSAFLKGAIDKDQYFVSNSIHSTYLKNEFKEKYKLTYVLACINSTLLNYYYNSKRLKGIDLYPQILISTLKLLPIPAITDARKLLASQINTFVDQILTLKKQNKDADTKNLESQIDQLVYKLYDLTPEEIEIVENSSKK